jgi:hypothetical protein
MLNALEILGEKSASNNEETWFQPINVKSVLKIQRRNVKSRHIKAQDINLLPIERETLGQ